MLITCGHLSLQYSERTSKKIYKLQNTFQCHMIMNSLTSPITDNSHKEI